MSRFLPSNQTWSMRLIEALNEQRDATLKVQSLLEEGADNAQRMRSIQDALLSFGTTIDTPGKIEVPNGIKPDGVKAFEAGVAAALAEGEPA